MGSPHPNDFDMVAVSYDARFDGESRMVSLVTFKYGPRPPGANPQPQPPDVRPANWSISSATQESPVSSWAKRTGDFAWGDFGRAANPVGDMYDGVTNLTPLIKITISQFEMQDPTYACRFVGTINEEDIPLGTLLIRPHQVLFSGVNFTPAVERFGDITYRGWQGQYEFLYKENPQGISFPLANGQHEIRRVRIGWDIAVPQTGFNCRAFVTAPGNELEDVFGQPLKHGDKGSRFYGRIFRDDEGDLRLPDDVTPGDKVRCMVTVFSYQGGGASQIPSAQPIALNDNGTPRKLGFVGFAGDIEPIVYAYQVYDSVNITNTLGLRLQ